MAKDVKDTIRDALASDGAKALIGTVVGEALKGVGSRSNGSGNQSSGSGRSNGSAPDEGHGGSHRPGVGALAAGAGAAALAPVAVKGIGKLIRGNAADMLAGGPKRLAEGAGSKLGDAVGDKVSSKIDDAGGPSGILKDTVKSALPFGGGGGGSKGGVDGVGKGRRMPVQQWIDVAVPLETAYNQWTQYEDWPTFMHRVTSVSQEDPCEVKFATKIWGKTKEFTAKIETQRPDERIKWQVSEGMLHTGVVTFHELAPRLTRIELGLDVQPGSLLEKAARGMRHVKRAARADLHRFKAFVEMLENETGAWRGVIEEGELVKDHPASYDRGREYGSADELLQDEDQDDKDDDGDEKDDKDDKKGDKPRRGRARAASNGRSGSSRSPSKSGRRSGGTRTRTQRKSPSSASKSTRPKKTQSSSQSGGRSRSRSSSNQGRGSGQRSRTRRS